MNRRVAVVVALAAVAAAAAGLAWQQAGDAGQEARPELQRLLDELVTGTARAAPGATAYVSGPRGTGAGAAGLADVRTSEAMRPDARMRLASVSKLWTAVVLLRLEEDGLLALDDPLERHVPGLHPEGDRITVRQLMNHTSGLVDDNDLAADPEQYFAQVADAELRAEVVAAAGELRRNPEFEFPAELVARFAATLPLRSEPGSAYHYSNIGYILAGRVAEAAGGAPLATLYEREIVEPLGLDRAAYDPRSRITGPHARGYELAPGGGLTDTTRRVADLDAHGGIVSNARDEGRFLVALMRGELVGPRQLAALKTPLATSSTASAPSSTRTGCAGMGYTHNGGAAGYTSSVYVTGDGGRVAVVLLNARATDEYADDLAKRTALRLLCAA